MCGVLAGRRRDQLQVQPQPKASQPQLQLELPETLPQELQPQLLQPQELPQPQPVLVPATLPEQQGLQQELATKSGNRMPFAPQELQELQELHAIIFSPRDKMFWKLLLPSHGMPPEAVWSQPAFRFRHSLRAGQDALLQGAIRTGDNILRHIHCALDRRYRPIPQLMSRAFVIFLAHCLHLTVILLSALCIYVRQVWSKKSKSGIL